MLILNHTQIERKIKRLSFQVAESYFEETDLIVAGIDGNGFNLAEKLFNELKLILNTKSIELVKVAVQKNDPSEKTLTLNFDPEKTSGKNIILVDDVLNSGRTMVYGLVPFIRARAKSIRTLVLADRNHKKFPVAADFVGISLSTTSDEFIDFEINPEGIMSLYLK